MGFSIIVALTNNRVIGRSNVIPWSLPYDMIWFKYHTLNKVVIMGRKTFESIGNKPLSNRLNIVLTRKNMILPRSRCNLIYVKSFEEALRFSKKIYNDNSEIMIIGGGEIYNLFFSQVSRLYLTCIDIVIQGDIFFSCYEKDEWRLVFSEQHNHCFAYSYSFKIFERSCKIYG